MAFTPKGDISNEFMYSWYKKHGNVIGIRYAQGTKQQNLSYDIIEKFKIRYPSLQEQDKLNSFISLLDTRISTQSRIIEKLKSLMKGLAENFTAFTPNTKIADCLNCHSSVLLENQVKSEGYYKVYGANGICGYSDSPAILEDAILIVKDGSGVGNVSYASGEYSVIGTSNYLTAKSGYSLKYLYYCLMIFNFVPYRTGMAIPHIYFKDYGKAKIFCPTYTKQLQYARLLSAIDKELSAEQRSLTNLCLQKQYLLRQMFI
jgi:type I restriction enzyme S subunit